MTRSQLGWFSCLALVIVLLLASGLMLATSAP